MPRIFEVASAEFLHPSGRLALGSRGERGFAEPVDDIRIRGARQHNLRNIDADVPRGKLVVLTGPSGCGKSSLAFHTLFAEGQRRYVESLSVYARQFLDQLEKPDVDSIEGLSPAIAIEQRSGGLNPRSTVATATEIHDYLRILWAAAGTPHDPLTGERLARMGPAEISAALAGLPENTKVMLLAPVPAEELDDPHRLIGDLRRQGFIRIRINGETVEVDEAVVAWPDHRPTVEIVIDRLVIRNDSTSRVADSVETALRICGSEAVAAVQEPGSTEWRDLHFPTAWRNPVTGFRIDSLTPRHFSFNSHLGACEACEGLGTELFCDTTRLIGDPDAPLARGVRGWWPEKSGRAGQFTREAAALVRTFALPEDISFAKLPDNARAVLFEGGTLDTGWKHGPRREPQTIDFEGLANEATRRHREARTDATRRALSRLMAHRPCHACGGRRLRPEWLAVRIEGAAERWLGIHDFCALPVHEALGWLRGIRLDPAQATVCERLVDDVRKRLSFLDEVGLGYLALDRPSGTLSGGEAQRIRLASQLGAGLSGVIYVLDEPSIGLHAADTARLVAALHKLRDLGNTVVVVEHDEEIIRAADHVIDMGPGAGSAGGTILGTGHPATLESPTGRWLREPPKPVLHRISNRSLDESRLVIRGAREHNLRGIDVTIPLGQLVCLAGPSGSGKSTLVEDILHRALVRRFQEAGETPGGHDSIDGIGSIAKCIACDQSPIGRSPRSNPATFTGAFDLIRGLFAKLPLSRQRGYGPARFSFNAAGGRCERCQGNGRLRIEMHFLPDAWINCPGCQGKRFNRETLEVTYKGKSIADVLELSVAEALALFRPVARLRPILATLDELGLGYLPLGQSAHTLSGGEAQRLKIALELARPQAPHTLYLFDEPTTGLHFGDVERLLAALGKLRDAGHSVLVIEHHPEVIRTADWVIELGPGGGADGGSLVFQGPPSALVAAADSPTGKALRLRASPAT